MTRIQAPATLLIGETGSGKSHSIAQMVNEFDLELFAIITEPNGLDTYLDVIKDLSKFHYVQINPARTTFLTQIAQAKFISSSDYEFLTKQRPTAGRDKAQFITLLSAFHDFVDQHGESFGPVANFTDRRVVALDSLSGVNLMAMDLVIGDKSAAHQGEWGVAMGRLEQLILALTSNLQCHLVVAAHLEREPDELTGGYKLMPSTLGRKLAPKIPRFFSEVVMPYREGEQYLWSTSAMNVALKKRALPLGHKLPPTFKPIIEAHERRRKAMEAKPLPSTTLPENVQ